MTDNKQITAYLRHISDRLTGNRSSLDNNGLLNGQTGIALFFFHLARGTGNNVYEEYAGELIDRICESLHPDMPAGYADGLAGLGVGMEYMIRQGFIDANADELLEDIDNIILHHTLYYLPPSPEISLGITGFGKYYTERLSNRTENPKDATKKKYLDEIIKALSCPYNTCGELLSVIHFLSGVIPWGVAPETTGAYLNYALDKLETLVYEDQHFGKNPGQFNPLIAASVLCQASEKTGNSTCFDKAGHYLQRYEPGFRAHIDRDLPMNMLKWSFLYSYLGKKVQSSEFLHLSEKCLNAFLTKESDQNAPVGLLDGYAGAGMYLLSLNNQCTDDWLDIVPCYVERTTPKIIMS